LNKGNGVSHWGHIPITNEPFSQMLKIPFDRLSLPAEQGLWQAGMNGVYIEIIFFRWC